MKINLCKQIENFYNKLLKNYQNKINNQKKKIMSYFRLINNYQNKLKKLNISKNHSKMIYVNQKKILKKKNSKLYSKLKTT